MKLKRKKKKKVIELLIWWMKFLFDVFVCFIHMDVLHASEPHAYGSPRRQKGLLDPLRLNFWATLWVVNSARATSALNNSLSHSSSSPRWRKF